MSKHRPHGWDYKPLTWGIFLELRKAAQQVADASGYPVYLAGSALNKEVPRDIDISVILPVDEFETLFGEIPEDQVEMAKYLVKVDFMFYPYTKYITFFKEYHMDVKVCPDIWWPDKPKMLIAEPKGG